MLEQFVTVVTQKELWMTQAPSFNFELDEDDLLVEALKRGFVSKVGNDAYLVNTDYQALSEQY